MIPRVVQRAIDHGAYVSVSISGGKDSQAMLSLITEMNLGNPQGTVHADLGRAEWPQTPAFVDHLAEHYRWKLSVVRREKGDLVQRIEERLNTVSTIDPTKPAKPFWPSAEQRYCTSDMKRGPIHKQQRALGKNALIVSCIGFRAEESRARAKREVLTVEKAISSKPYKQLTPAAALKLYLRRWRDEPAKCGRLVLTWLPIHTWRVGRVWGQLGTTETELRRRQAWYNAGETEKALDGWPAHVAYVYGNERLSCALCVLASLGDLCNGKKHHPELYRKYLQLEKRSGYTFKNNFSLTELS